MYKRQPVGTDPFGNDDFHKIGVETINESGGQNHQMTDISFGFGHMFFLSYSAIR